MPATKRDREPTRRRSKKLRVLLALASAGLTLVLVEVTCSLVLHLMPSPVNVAPDEVQRELPLPHDGSPAIAHPVLGSVNAKNYRNRWSSTNSFGLRNGEIDEVAGDDTLRVLVLGGSVAWGFGARSNDETLSAYLERWLDQHRDGVPRIGDRRVEVLNAGVVGYRSWQEAIAYESTWRRLQPDVVVTIDGVNEVFGSIYTRRTGPPIDDEASFGRWLKRRLVKMKVVKLYKRLVSPTLDHDGLPTPAEITDAYARSLARIEQLARADGALFVPVLQPTLAIEGAKLLTPYEEQLQQLNENLGIGVNAHFEACYRLFRDLFARLATRGDDVIAIDASMAFAGEHEVCFVDSCHLTDRARRALAAFIGERLVAALRQ